MQHLALSFDERLAGVRGREEGVKGLALLPLQLKACPESPLPLPPEGAGRWALLQQLLGFFSFFFFKS